jgi:hypothetical protein
MILWIEKRLEYTVSLDGTDDMGFSPQKLPSSIYCTLEGILKKALHTHTHAHTHTRVHGIEKFWD